MDTHEEKRDGKSSSVTVDVQQLKQDIEENAAVVIRYEQMLLGRTGRRSRNSAQPTQPRSVSCFVASAPSVVLRNLNLRLRRLARKILVAWHDTMWRLARSLVGDHIRLEDALGRRMRIPFHIFSQKRTVHQHIKHLFAGLPGEYQVKRGRFRLDLKGSSNGVKQQAVDCELRSGDRVVMSIISLMPAGLAKRPRRWRCPGCGTLASQISSTSSYKCGQCGQTYLTESAPFRRHVTPVDGNELMLVQKKVIRANQENPYDSIFPDTAVSPGSEDVNCGLKQIKHVVLVETKEPLRVLDATEELLCQVNHVSKSVHNDNKGSSLHQLSNTIAFLRKEAKRENEINLFDFEKEHIQFMQAAREVMRSLQGRLDAPANNGSRPAYRKIDHMGSLAKWTKQRFPLAVLSCPPAPQTKDIVNVEGKADPQVLNPDPDSCATLLMIKSLVEGLYCLRVNPDLTIRDLKVTLQDREALPVSEQYLVSQGRKLQDHQTVRECGLAGQPRWYVHVLLSIWDEQRCDVVNIDAE